jgi:hypothetical protein
LAVSDKDSLASLSHPSLTEHMRRASYSLVIRRLEHLKRFDSPIGFSVRRKDQKLKDALAILPKYGRRVAPTEWAKQYLKRNGEWVRRR